MKKVILFFVILVGGLFTSCTQNEMAKQFGGKMEYSLKPNEVLINATWKENQLWILTRDTLTGVCYFREKSTFGVMEGQVTIK